MSVPFRIASLTATFLIVSFFGLASFQTKAQRPASGQEPLRIKTDLIQLRAVVTDKQGKVVEGLAAEDFELLENNRPQKIEFFAKEIVGVGKPAVQASAETKNAAVPATALPTTAKPARTIALFVDNIHMTFDSLDRTKQTLRRFVNEQMTDNDLVCIITAAGSVGIVNQFTQDRQILLRAIEKLTLWRINDNDTLLSPYLAARILQNQLDYLVLGMAILESENPTIRNMPTKILESEVKSRSTMILAEASNQRAVLLSTLKSLTERLIELPGQRMLFCFSDGFSLAGIGGGFDVVDLTPVTSRAVRSGVVFYSFGAQGLTVQMLPASHPGIVEGAKRYILSSQPGRSAVEITVPPLQNYLSARNNDQKIGLNTLALDTGGKPFFETNDLNGRMAQALDENRVYYALAYYPEDLSNPNKARKITVRVKGHPDYEVRAQRSYVPAELGLVEKDPAPLTLRQRLAKAMIFPVPMNSLGISVTANYFEREGDTNQVLLQTNLETDKLDFQLKNGAYAFNVETATAIYDGAGKLINGWSEIVSGGLKPEQVETAKKNGFSQSKWMSLKPGLYQVRVGIMEPGTERLGTALAWIEVPKLGQNKTLLSHLMLAQESASQAKSDKSVARLQLRQGIRFYRRGETLVYFLRVYPAANLKQVETDLTVQTQIVQGDRMVYQSQWLPLGERAVAKDKISVELNGELQLNSVKPGLYLLRVLVKDPKAAQPLQREELFSVEP